MPVSTFIAYPGGLQLVKEAVTNALLHLRATASNLVSPMNWEEMDIPGRFVASEVLTNIDSSDFIVADISRLNFNVVYEIGYAIGKGQRVLLTKHRSIASDGLALNDLGLFDTLGWKEYSNGQELTENIQGFDHSRFLAIVEKPNHQSPITRLLRSTSTQD